MKKLLLAFTAFVALASVGNAKDIKAVRTNLPSLSELAKTTFIAPLMKTGSNQLLETTAVKLSKLVFTPIDTVSSIYNVIMRGDACVKPFYYDKANNVYTYVMHTPDLNVRTSSDFVNWGPKLLAWDTSAIATIQGWAFLVPSVMTAKVNDSLYAFTGGKTMYNSSTGAALCMQSSVNLSDGSGPVPFVSTTYTSTDEVAYSWFSEPSYINGGIDNDGYFNFVKLTQALPEVLSATDNSGIYFENYKTNFQVDPSYTQGVAIPSTAFAAGSTDNSIQSTIIGSTQSGNKIFVAFSGMFSSDPSFYAPGFVSSDNFGESWSDPIVVPKSVFQAYAKLRSFQNQDSFNLNYFTSTKTMLANQDGTFSLFTQISELNSSKTLYSIKKYLIEVYYNGSSWSIREVSAITPIGLYSYYDVDGAYQYGLDPLAGEVQSGKTEDDQYYVVKWLDASDYQATTTSGTTILTPKTAMYVAARYKTSTKWSVYQISDTSTYDSHYYLPGIVPTNLVDVPLLAIKPIYSGMEVTKVDSIETATKLYNVITNDEGAQVRDDLKGIIATTKFTIPVANLGVEDNNQAIFSQNIEIANIAPNPSAGDNTYLTLNIAQTGYVKVEIFDMMGRLMATPCNRLLNEGCQAISLNKLNLSDGTYSVVVTSNDFRASKLMTIVR